MTLTNVREADLAMSTRQKILDTALQLFSIKGYSAVSIRDICKAVGIRESSVYYHFTNKREIFDVLLAEFEQITVSIQNRFNSATADIRELEEGPFVAVGLAFLKNYFLNGKVLPFLHMLSIEKHVDGEAAELYRKTLFDAPLEHNEKVIGRLIGAGLFKDGDVRRMAEEYHAAILFIFQRYFSFGEAAEETIKQANERLAALLTDYYQRYRRMPEKRGA